MQGLYVPVGQEAVSSAVCPHKLLNSILILMKYEEPMMALCIQTQSMKATPGL